MADLTCDQIDQNFKRAERGKEFLDAYEAQHDKGESYEIVLTDLLADLMHACIDLAGGNNEPLDFDRCVTMARMHFEAEINGED